MLAAVAIGACGGPSGAAQAEPGPGEAGAALPANLQAVFDLWDTDRNGIVEAEEYDRFGGGPSHYDIDKDGKLTAGEYARYHGVGPKEASTTSSADRTAPAAPPRQGVEAQAKASSERTVFDLWDANGDGVVAGAEYNRRGGGPDHYDLNKDGTLTLQEYNDYLGGRTQPKGGAAGQQSSSRQLPRSLPTGRYSCLHVYYDFLDKRMMQDQLGFLTVLPNQKYRWFEGQEGSFAYDGAGGVEWKGGYFGGANVKDSSVEWKGDSLMLKVVLATPKKDLTYRCYRS
jgi:hypothetical protein